MTQRLLIERGTEKTILAEIPDDSHVTFGPFSPPTGKTTAVYNESKLVGTLRVYKGKTGTTNIIAMWTNVSSFRNLDEIDYQEQVAKEEGAILWKSGKNGYTREEKVKKAKEWVAPDKDVKLLA